MATVRQLLACSLVVLFFTNAASAASVTWVSDFRSLDVESNYGSDSATTGFGTTTWDTSISAGWAEASQNTTIGTTSVFGGTGYVYMDGVTDYYSFSVFSVHFRVADGGTTLDLTGEYGGYTGEFGAAGGYASFALKQGDTSIYSGSEGVINYSGFLADGDYEISVIAGISGAGFAEGGAGFDFSGEFGTSTVTFVPVPAAVWLFGSALAGLGWIRRKKLPSLGPRRHAHNQCNQFAPFSRRTLLSQRPCCRRYGAEPDIATVSQPACDVLAIG